MSQLVSTVLGAGDKAKTPADEMKAARWMLFRVGGSQVTHLDFERQSYLAIQ
jgi:hypothetical protein